METMRARSSTFRRDRANCSSIAGGAAQAAMKASEWAEKDRNITSRDAAIPSARSRFFESVQIVAAGFNLERRTARAG